VLYDHGSGVVADFVTISRSPIVTDVVPYQCKGSRTKAAAAWMTQPRSACRP
jgi:hypothetical protein